VAEDDPYKIIGYVYQGHSYCDGVCVVEALGGQVTGSPYLIADEVIYKIKNNDQVENILDATAAQVGIDRVDNADSSEFPLTILSGFTSPAPVMCDDCGLWLKELSPGELGLVRCPCGGWKPETDGTPGCNDCRERSISTGYMTADQGASTPPTRWNTGWASDGGISVGG
jgi:hypothetical protein